uniref:Uncharacterized protein n=1 Tax=Anguilla anguilla TaxID=7936 RepID=A0A0E9V810_ANGAN
MDSLRQSPPFTIWHKCDTGKHVETEHILLSLTASIL